MFCVLLPPSSSSLFLLISSVLFTGVANREKLPPHGRRGKGGGEREGGRAAGFVLWLQKQEGLANRQGIRQKNILILDLTLCVDNVGNKVFDSSVFV